jgi:hypothetical protein
MESAGLLIIAAIVLIAVGLGLGRQRKRAASMDLEDTSWLRTAVTHGSPGQDLQTAPVRDFHVHGAEARVTFDVPLGDEDDPVLDELLVDQAVEVVRAKRHTLPIDEVTEIVVFAGQGEPKEIGRTRLPAAGMLPPPIQAELFNLDHVARDPFSAQFEIDHTLTVDTVAPVPTDELKPLREELKVPAGLARGLRARGVDPTASSAPELLLALLKMFGYTLVPQGEPDVYIASRDNRHTFVRTITHHPGEHPELDESEVAKFNVEFETSGAHRGILITDKYGPFMINDMEVRNPKLRFVTRQRMQAFIDSMALS